MKILISLLFVLQSYIYACTLCATDIPQVLVNATISSESQKTIIDVKWKFHEQFVQSLTQYDLNENGVFDPDEKEMIKESLVTYIEKLHYLTDIEYKKFNQHTEQEFIQKLDILSSEMKFIDNTMMYEYTISLPFALENQNIFYIGFSDEYNNFAFTLENLTLTNYTHSYSLEKEYMSAKINLGKFTDTTINKPKTDSVEKITIPKAEEDKEGLEDELTYVEILSEKLTLLKEDLKITLKDIKENNTVSSYIWLLLFSFLYGILHAIGPGHGKSLVSSYFISQDKSYIKAFSISSLIGVVHTFSAFILTLVVYYSVGFIFNSTIVNVEQTATQVSAIIIILIAVFLLVKKIEKSKPSFTFTANKDASNILSPKVTHAQTLSCGCNSCKTTSTDIGVILAAGIIPCPGTVTIFLFTMSLEIYFVGFMSALFMSAGMSLIIFITAIISVKVRKSTKQNHTLVKFFEYASLIFILCLGIFLFAVS